jgi:hypothetical protein
MTLNENPSSLPSSSSSSSSPPICNFGPVVEELLADWDRVFAISERMRPPRRKISRQRAFLVSHVVQKTGDFAGEFNARGYIRFNSAEIEYDSPSTFTRIRFERFAFDGVQEVWTCAEEVRVAEFPSLGCG